VILIPRLGKNRISEGWLFGGPVSRILRHYLSWFVVDFLVALLSVGMVGVMWRISGPLDVGLGRSVALATLLAFLFSLFNTILGVRSVSWSHAAPKTRCACSSPAVR
jgi:hypothetical protein